MLKLKLQYFGHLMPRVDSLEKTLMLGGIGGGEEKGTTEDEMAGWHHWLNGCESEWTRVLVMDRVTWRAAIHGVAKSRTRLSDGSDLNWTELIVELYTYLHFFLFIVTYNLYLKLLYLIDIWTRKIWKGTSPILTKNISGMWNYWLF